MTPQTSQPVDPRSLAKSAVVVAVPKVNGQKLVMKMPVTTAIQAELQKPQAITPLGTVISKEEVVAQSCVAKAMEENTEAIKVVMKDSRITKEDVKKIVPEIAQPQKQTTKTIDNTKNLGEYAKTGGPGRPLKKNSIDNAIQEELDKAHAVTADGSTLTKRDMIAKKAVERALEGDMKAMIYVAERTEGKPMQKIQVVAPEDESGTVMGKEAEAKLEQVFGR